MLRLQSLNLKSTTLLLFCIAVGVVYADDKPSDESVQEKSDIRAPDIWVEGNLYQVKAANGGRLTLTSANFDGTVQRTEYLSFDEFASWQAKEVISFVWNRNRLGVVVEYEREGNRKFHCVLLPQAERTNNGIRIAASPRLAATVYETKDDLGILAANGSIRGDSIILVFGAIPLRNGEREFSKAVIYVHDCPRPPVGGKAWMLKESGRVP